MLPSVSGVSWDFSIIDCADSFFLGEGGGHTQRFSLLFFSPPPSVACGGQRWEGPCSRWEGPCSSVNQTVNLDIFLFFLTIKRKQYLHFLPIKTHFLWEGLGSGKGRGHSKVALTEARGWSRRGWGGLFYFKFFWENLLWILKSKEKNELIWSRCAILLLIETRKPQVGGRLTLGGSLLGARGQGPLESFPVYYVRTVVAFWFILMFWIFLFFKKIMIFFFCFIFLGCKLWSVSLWNFAV